MIRSPHYHLMLLALITAIASVDRQVLTILIEPIRHDLQLNDATLGALSGTAFAVFYATAAFPLARMGDRGDRRVILAACAIVWSLATAACGLARSFFELMLARIGVAVGEAGATPISQSLLVDLYPPERRAFVFAILNAALSIGLGLGFALGGWLATIFPWRTVFMLVGLPGLLLGGLLYFTARDPRAAVVGGTASSSGQPAFLRSLVEVWRIPGLPWILLVSGATAITGVGMLVWSPSFLVRVHHMDLATAGFWLGVTTMAGLAAGSLLSGWLCDRASRRDIRWYAWISAAGLFLAIPCAIAFVLWPTPAGAITCFFFLKFTVTLYTPAFQTLALNLAPANLRATTSATIGMSINLAGAGIGPLVAGLISDYLEPRYGDLSIRYSLIVITAGIVVAAFSALVVGHKLKVRGDGTAALPARPAGSPA